MMLALLRRIATPATAACIAALLASLGFEAEWAEGAFWEHVVEAIAAFVAVAGLLQGIFAK